MAKRRRVLFVDDDADLLASLRRALHGGPFDVLCETSGESALLALGREDCDVVVVDARMPGMGGVELCGVVAREHPGVIVMMLSGSLTAADLIAAINVGHVYKVLEKPCPVAEIRLAVIMALRHKVELEQLYRSVPCDDYLPHDREA